MEFFISLNIHVINTNTGFVHFSRNNFPGLFQDFFRTQIDFSRAPKCTIIEATNPYEIEIQK